MQLNKKFVVLTFAFLVVVFFSFVTSTHAALDLTVDPVDGGGTIRFSRGDLTSGITKEVRVRVTSNENIQYQIFQQLISPFSNERGVSVVRPILEASIVPSSMGSGASYLVNYEPISRSEQLIYTSAANGQSDSFTLVYRIATENLNDSGNFNGLINFIIKPVSGGQRQTVQANVFVESNAELSINVEGSVARNLVRIDPKSDATTNYVKVAFNGNTGGPIRIYQEVIRYPTDDLNSELKHDILKVVANGGQSSESALQNPAEIPRGRFLIYHSSLQSDSFSVFFQLLPKELLQQKAGTYRGLIRYSIETETSQKDFDIDLEVSVLPLFEIAMTFSKGPISFSGLLPGSDPQVREVDVEVKSNLQRPYVINQKVSEALSNEKGQAIPKKYFVFRQQLLDNGPGRVANDDFLPIEKGDSTIFYSDKKGTPVKLKVYYRLSPFAEMQPGDYRTMILFSLGEL